MSRFVKVVLGGNVSYWPAHREHDEAPTPFEHSANGREAGGAIRTDDAMQTVTIDHQVEIIVGDGRQRNNVVYAKDRRCASLIHRDHLRLFRDAATARAQEVGERPSVSAIIGELVEANKS